MAEYVVYMLAIILQGGMLIDIIAEQLDAL